MPQPTQEIPAMSAELLDEVGALVGADVGPEDVQKIIDKIEATGGPRLKPEDLPRTLRKLAADKTSGATPAGATIDDLHALVVTSQALGKNRGNVSRHRKPVH